MKITQLQYYFNSRPVLNKYSRFPYITVERLTETDSVIEGESSQRTLVKFECFVRVTLLSGHSEMLRSSEGTQ